MKQLSLIENVTFSVDLPSRTLRGLVVPWDSVSSLNDGGRTFRFARGSIKAIAAKFVKLFEDHSPLKNRGRALDMQETDSGLEMVFQVRDDADGDELLSKAANGLKTGLSVGVEFDELDTEPDPQNPGSFLVTLANLTEVSVVKNPSFTQSHITAVMMSKHPIGENMDNENTAVETDVTAKNEQKPEVKAAEFADKPEVIAPRNNIAVVTEPKNYVFDRNGKLQKGKYDFGIDFIRAYNPAFADRDARDRVEEFVTAQFDVVSGNVNELNPTINVPRYVDQRAYKNPVWEAVNKGTLTDGITPIQWPVFSSSSGLVAAGTEGTEPDSGTYVTALGTVTPTTLRGKLKISREVWDQGGVPNSGDIFWDAMVRDYEDAKEAKVVATLDAASPTSLGSLTAGGGTDKQTLVAELRAGFAGLQFVRGGFRQGLLFAQIDLYKALIAAQDDTGRPLFPAVSPMNADGSVSDKLATININGVTVIPTRALAATGTVAASSYLVDPSAIGAWATNPRRLLLEPEVSNVYLGIWGYAATVILDIAGVREVIYDPTSGD